MKRMRTIVTAAALLLVGFGGLVAAPSVLAASPQSTVCDALGSNAGCTKTPSGSADLNKVIKAIIDILSVIVGIVAVIMLIVGGFRYVTSNGDSSRVSGAKNTIVYALIGIVLVALSQTIVQFTLAKATDQSTGHTCPSGQVYKGGKCVKK